VQPASEAGEIIDWVSRVLKEERGLVIASPPLEATIFQVENTKWAYVFYESGLSINVLYTLDDAGKRAVGLKLSEGMEVPAELSRFKFARQKSKLAGTIRGPYFVIKGGLPSDRRVHQEAGVVAAEAGGPGRSTDRPADRPRGPHDARILRGCGAIGE